MMSGQGKTNFVVGSKSYTAVAVNTAARTGEWISSKLGDFNRLTHKSSSRDLVTEIDKGAEQMIRNLIATYFPQHVFVGEESVPAGGLEEALREASEAEYAWIVDPIDGTTNFVHGFPFFSVSIALAHRGEIIVGVVYDPSHNEMFVAEKGKGAYLRGQRIHVSGETTLGDSLMASGFPANADNAARNLQSMNAVLPLVRNVRTTGSAALHLAYTAAGRISGFWEYGLSAWDYAAGVLLVTEAGGSVTDVSGAPYMLGTSNMAATNGAIHAELIQQLNQA